VFDGPSAFAQWTHNNPAEVAKLYEPLHSGGLWSTLLFLAFTAAFVLPRQYHMTFTENEHPKHLNVAYWMFPLFLLLLNLPIVPILFAGKHLSLSVQPDFYVLAIMQTLGREGLAVLVFLGGVSAASAMMIVTTLALSYMCLNYVLLPASLTSNSPKDFYQRLIWNKRIVISLIIAAGYGFYLIIELNEGLARLGLISFVAAAQLLPGVLGLLFWSRANRIGFLAGLVGGALVWFLLLIWPLFSPDSTFCSLTVNAVLFVIGSLLHTPTLEEENASQLALAQRSFAVSGQGAARSALTYSYAMQPVLGKKAADDELERALTHTGIAIDETRPAQLRLLHEQLERNLTGLIGPTLAREILRQKRNPASEMQRAETADNRLLELRLETSREQMRGMTRQLDDLRRYLREVLYHLPLGVCSIDETGKVYLWNSAMESLTGVPERQAQDRPLAMRFALDLNDKRMSINLHKATIPGTSDTPNAAGQVILMEDRTHLDTLESELAHSERLASIGRLAAGVAHEIGNPLTGIASLAQNLQYEIRDESADDGTEVVQEHTADILEQVDRINRIVRSLLTFSHELDVPENTYVNGDANHLAQIFLNLISNACDASPNNTGVQVQCTSDVDWHTITVTDHGNGIDQADREQIFEPFFTTKPVGSGTGLGLSMVYSLVDDHDGVIRLDEDYTDGTRMIVQLPESHPHYRRRRSYRKSSNAIIRTKPV